MQRCQLTDPVVCGDRARPARLVDIDDEMRTPHRDVDGFAELRGKSFADRPALLGEVQTADHRIGQTQHAKTQAVFTAVLNLLNQFAIFQGSE